ncbi:AraC family transcriptional regulator [Coraliomargarita parva]|uniref:AraC family transcriptional regulator n=1 Tax=Coraliomargarita parva TaxID=3014050 RepID=UPI0022B5CA3C|nr:AraC family transcriptional regulator [Coraliomargarita parva]
MKPTKESYSRYLPPDTSVSQWGWRLIDAGRQQCHPGGAYPAPGHPLAYQFDNNGRRVLSEYQILYISAGSGFFESSSCKLTTLSAGDACLIFPGEWHRYTPSSDTGWSEYWVGFEGREADRVVTTFFNRNNPVFQTIYSAELIRLFEQQLEWLQAPKAGGEQVLASHIPLQLSLMRASALSDLSNKPLTRRVVSKAKARLLEAGPERTDLEALAMELGISYSSFRSTFREHTGYSPREFENLIKLNKSKDMLRSGEYNVSDTAEALGFASVHYFSRAFKRQFGVSPLHWLEARKDVQP